MSATSCRSEWIRLSSPVTFWLVQDMVLSIFLTPCGSPMTRVPHGRHLAAEAILGSHSDAVEPSPEPMREAMARAFQPIIPGFLVPVIVFYLVISIRHVLLRSPADAALLASLSA